MAVELAPHNVQVNAIAPGWFGTDMTAPVKTMPALHDEIMLRTPAGRCRWWLCYTIDRVREAGIFINGWCWL